MEYFVQAKELDLKMFTFFLKYCRFVFVFALESADAAAAAAANAASSWSFPSRSFSYSNSRSFENVDSAFTNWLLILKKQEEK